MSKCDIVVLIESELVVWMCELVSEYLDVNFDMLIIIWDMIRLGCWYEFVDFLKKWDLIDVMQLLMCFWFKQVWKLFKWLFVNLFIKVVVELCLEF